MRIKLVFLALFLLSLVQQNANCQSSIAISESGNWITNFSNGAPPTEYYYYYKTGGDTLLEGKNYIKIYKASLHYGGPYSSYLTEPLTYCYGFRNDSLKKAYILPANDTIEHLWYDFNLSVGDTLPEISKWYSTEFIYPGDNIIVTNIDSVQYCNSFYKRFSFNNPQFPKLVQGIGFTGDLIYINGIYFESYVNLMFWSPDSSMADCFLQLVGIQTNQIIKPDISINPNPANNFINIKSNNEIKNITIFNQEGRKIFSKNISGTLENIDVKQLSEGVYFAVISFSDSTTVFRKVMIIRE